MSEKKLFSSLSALVVGAVAGVSVAATPVVAAAEHADGHEESEKKCSGEHGCAGDKKDGHDDEKKGHGDDHGHDH